MSHYLTKTFDIRPHGESDFRAKKDRFLKLVAFSHPEPPSIGNDNQSENTPDPSNTRNQEGDRSLLRAPFSLYLIFCAK